MPNDKAEFTATTEFAALLDLLGFEADERVSICSQKPGRAFEGTVPRHRADAVALTLSTPYREQRDVWFGVNPVALPAGYRGRGGDEHVTRCAALFADIDIKSGGVSDTQVADTVTKEISAALGQPPVAVVFSGHGGHTYWTLDPDDNAWTLDTEAKRIAAQAIYRRFHRLCADIAGKFGGCVDNVGQLSRILRVPGTYNRKNPDDPTLVELTDYPYGTGGPLTFAEVAEALDAYGVPEVTEDRRTLGAVISQPAGWKFGERTSAYVAAMVHGWPIDRPGSRHGWLVSAATRLACAHRLGQITVEDHAQAVAALDERFGWLLATHGQVRKATPGEVAGAVAWGVQRAASMTDDEAADEIGGPLDVDGEGQDHDEHEVPLGVTLPLEFWESRASLRHIRDAALTRRAAPDAVLGSSLARIAAHIPPAVRVDTGIMSPLPLHLYATSVSWSGKGKTSAMTASAQIMRLVPNWPTDPMSVSGDDERPVLVPLGETFPRIGKIRSGEGIAEMYWGEVTVIGPNDKRVKERRRVRSNVLMHTDEAHSLVKYIADPKSTVGETLREAWSDQAIGQSNADGSRYRFVPAGTYRLAVIVGFHLSVLADLLTTEQILLGTPQRFLNMWSKPDPKQVSRELLAGLTDPGVLDVMIPTAGMRLCAPLRAKVDENRIADWLRDDTDDNEPDLASQRVAMVARVAGLLAILDGRTDRDETGSLVINEDDWRLAETMFETSRAICTLAIADRRRRAAKVKSTERASTLAAEVEAEDAKATPEGRVRLRILGYLVSADGRAQWNGRGGLYKRFNGDDAAIAEDVLGQMETDGQIRLTIEKRSQFVELIR